MTAQQPTEPSEDLSELKWDSYCTEMGMGPLTAELQSGRGGEMGLFPPKCFGEGLPRAWNAKARHQQMVWGNLQGLMLQQGQRLPEIGSIAGKGSEKRCCLFSVSQEHFLQWGWRAVAREGEQFQGAVPGLSLLCHCHTSPGQGCSAHLVLPPRTLKATLVLFPFLSGGTELPQLS